MDFSKTLFRCSGIGNLMTEPRNKSDKDAGNLSETVKTWLTEIYILKKYGREKDISNKYIEKGLGCEEDSITLYSRIKKAFFKKNTERINNDYLTGEVDLFTGKSIREAKEIIDTKTSWDIYSFFKNKLEKLKPQYFYQAHGYMALTGAESATVAFCLVNTPESMIEDEKRRLWYKLGGDKADPRIYKEACELLDVSMRFDDIPLKERLIEKTVERDQSIIEDIYIKCQRARVHLQSLETVMNL